jgi:hypothetical protein
MIYTNGSWVDVTGRVEVIERPYVSVTNSLLHQMLNFNKDPEHSYTSDIISSIYSGIGGFNNTWAPHQSRLMMLNGTLNDVGAFWEGLESLKDGEITLFTGATNYVRDCIVNGTYFNTYSSATELKTVQLTITENEYMYNVILSDDQMFVTDDFGIEVFIEPRN